MLIRGALLTLIGASLAGCVVGQPPGRGQVLHLQEPTTKARYWLYLPEDYVQADGQVTAHKWPLVMTFHGMKPFDAANPQIREWQQEADRYGYVVVAPELVSPDLLREFPMRHVNPGVKRDEEATIAIMDDVARRVDIDPGAVLSTSWSSGGYLAHYMANRHPDRFTCIAPRQSNFSADVLDPAQVPRYRNRKVGIFYTQNDFAICRQESQEAARWYSRHGFDVTFAVFKDLGHERRPSIAASFFARTCGATAKTPPLEIARMQVQDMPVVATGGPMPQPAGLTGPSRAGEPPEALASATGAVPPRPTPTGPAAKPTGGPPPTGTPSPRPGLETSGPLAAKPVTNPRSPAPPTPLRSGTAAESTDTHPVRVRVSSTIGISPLLVSFSAVVPAELRRGAYFLWTVNGEPISNGLNGQKQFSAPGDYELEVFVTTADGRELRARKVVTVLERVDNSSPAGAGR